MIIEAYIDGTQIHDISGAAAVGSYALTSFNGLGTPTPRTNRPARARRHGLYELTTYYDGRAITLEGRVKESAFAAFWAAVDELKQQFALNGLVHVLKWKRQGEEFLFRSSVSVANELEMNIVGGRTTPQMNWSVDLIAYDPRIYKDLLEDFTFSSTANVTNDGNFNTMPVITFNSPGTNPGLRNDALSAENEINFDYGGGGSALVVDMLRREVHLDGASRPDLIDLPNTSFWSLVTGTNHLTKIGGASSIKIEWRAAWV